MVALRSLGFDPFVVAAMGSHGGGTAQGQRDLLSELGVTEAAVGCPIRCDMDTVVLGTNSFGLPIHFDRNAFSADGVVLLNRIKPHTSFTGRYESGLLKMLSVGLGKREGAAQVHKLGLPGLSVLVPEVGGFLLEKTPVKLGIGILEKLRRNTRPGLSPLSPKTCWTSSRGCWIKRRADGANLPFDQIDALVVGELGRTTAEPDSIPT